jgi:hypothetical protein
MCGSVRYVAVGTPLNSRVCHCRQCQKAVGAAFNARILFPGNQVTFDGAPSRAHSSDDLERGFCAACGTSIYTHRLSTNWTGVTAGSLDDPSQFQPEAHTWVSEKQQWLVICDGLPQFEKMPPRHSKQSL